MSLSSVLKPLVVLDAPSNLGLRPPVEGSVPGCYKMPWMLHERSLVSTLGAAYAGVVVPPRYAAQKTKDEGDRNGDEIAAYSRALADRVGALVDSQKFPLVVGGDCSILVGNALALGQRGRYGLVFIDAHSDYRHPGNAPVIGAAAGEDLAIVTGKGDERLTRLAGQPSIRPDDVAVLGVLDSDDYLQELRSAGMAVVTNADFGYTSEVAGFLDALRQRTQGFWVHFDCDVIDRSEMTAVDCPEETGISFQRAAEVVGLLVGRPECVGMELTIYDPDLDPTGVQCDRIVAFLTAVFKARTRSER